MFESDDFDLVLSQFDFPEVTSNNMSQAMPSKTRAENVPDKDLVANIHSKNTITNGSKRTSPKLLQMVTYTSQSPPQKLDTSKKPDRIPSASTSASKDDSVAPVSNIGVKRASVSKDDHFTAPKRPKHIIIDKHFDNQIKRRFPGPAGILRGPLEEGRKNNETIGNIELLSQDIKYTENEHREFFESPLWIRVLEDVKSWKISNIETIKAIKEQVLVGGSHRRKAQTVTALVETVDHRHELDPFISLRDATDNIHCTLHREVWSAFAPFIGAENCVLVLWKPTVLLIQRPLKKYYLNITMRNIHVIYSSAIIKDEECILPNGYTKVQEDDLTVIKTENPLPNVSDVSEMWSNEDADGSISDKDLASIFSDELF